MTICITTTVLHVKQQKIIKPDPVTVSGVAVDMNVTVAVHNAE